ncbi:MAG: hypothetical protein JO199_03335 [Candidatus Eremiobacteraeota bacterium]|nr:hypothetical protein [Candidatus Eremiobacteraeota bacterium]
MSYDGTNLLLVVTNRCHRQLEPEDAPPYVAPTSAPVAIASPVTVAPTCVPSPVPSSAPPLYIVGMPLNGHHGHDRGPGPGFNAIAIAGPALANSNPWSFSPTATTLQLQGGQQYVFFVAAALPPPPPTPSPSPTPAPTQSPTGNFYLLGAMSYNGSTFTVVPTSHCNFHANPFEAPPYQASSSGTLTLAAPVQVTPTCIPSPLPSALPSPLPQLYIVGMQVPPHHGHAVLTQHDGGHFAWPAVEIAGPASITSTPWSFAPDSPGLNLQAGQNYVFFVAIGVPSPPPTPSPPQAYRSVVPLDYDGTNFTAAGTPCNGFTPPSPYPAPTTGPLTLSGAVTVTPTCAPSNPSTSLYIVATLAGWTGDASKHPADGKGPLLYGVAIAGPATASSNPWSFTPYPTPLTLVSGVNYLFYVAQPVESHGH